MTSQSFHKTLNALAHPRIAFYLLPVIMALLVIGTVAQKYMGVHTAQITYFSSFYFWLGPVPLPGGYIVFGAFTLSLLAKFIARSDWSWPKSGIILSHLGVLILLIGGFVTVLSAREGYMAIGEGETSQFIYDYHVRELVIAQENGDHFIIPFTEAQKGDVYELDFDVMILNKCDNCTIERREESAQDKGSRPLLGMAQFMALKEIPSLKETEQNISGITLAIENAQNPEQNGVYIAFEGMPRPIEINHNDKRYQIVLGKQQRLMPFSLELIDFTKESYPGTNKARSYSSDIIVHDQGSNWPVTISMNEPLRYRGYTFYQSAFEENNRETVTVLSVVENKGRIFPYIGTLVIGIGLIIHLGLMVFKRKAS